MFFSHLGYKPLAIIINLNIGKEWPPLDSESQPLLIVNSEQWFKGFRKNVSWIQTVFNSYQISSLLSTNRKLWMALVNNSDGLSKIPLIVLSKRYSDSKRLYQMAYCQINPYPVIIWLACPAKNWLGLEFQNMNSIILHYLNIRLRSEPGFSCYSQSYKGNKSLRLV